jgi:NADPH-dependent curcumin reductase CurA
MSDSSITTPPNQPIRSTAGAPETTRQIVIQEVPQGPLEATHFELQEVPVPALAEGELLVETLAITIGAGQRAGLQGSAGYAGPAEADAVMTGTGVGRVLLSNHDSIEAGAVVMGLTGWTEHAVLKGKRATVVNGAGAPATLLGALGTNGLTAYFGLLDVGEPQPGETVVVSAAGGSVGHLVGQIAKLRGATVVGVAGSDEKCASLIDDLGFDRAVNYKADDFRAAFKAATPDRIDVYFDNTGGDILGSALFRMNAHGRIVCCGVVSQYDTSTPGPGPRGVPGLLVNNRVRMQGFLVFDYADRFAEARAEISGWLASGELIARTTEFDGLDAAPHAFVDLLAGRTVGTTVINVSS